MTDETVRRDAPAFCAEVVTADDLMPAEIGMQLSNVIGLVERSDNEHWRHHWSRVLMFMLACSGLLRGAVAYEADGSPLGTVNGLERIADGDTVVRGDDAIDGDTLQVFCEVYSEPGGAFLGLPGITATGTEALLELAKARLAVAPTAAEDNALGDVSDRQEMMARRSPPLSSPVRRCEYPLCAKPGRYGFGPPGWAKQHWSCRDHRDHFEAMAKPGTPRSLAHRPRREVPPSPAAGGLRQSLSDHCRTCGVLLAWPLPVGVIYADGTAECMACLDADNGLTAQLDRTEQVT